MAQLKHEGGVAKYSCTEGSFSLGGKMCSGCFMLFEQATDYILEAHRTELERLNNTQHSVITALLDYKKAIAASGKRESPEASEMFRKVGIATGLTVLEDPVDPQLPKDVRFPIPRPISPLPQPHDVQMVSRAPANEKLQDDRRLLRQVVNNKQEHHVVKQVQVVESKEPPIPVEEKQKFRAIISSPSKSPPVSRLSTSTGASKPTPQIAKPLGLAEGKATSQKQLEHSDSKRNPLSSTLKSTQSAPAYDLVPMYKEVSEIDRKIQELENEQLFLGGASHQMLRVNSPVTLHNPHKKLTSTAQEGRSLETDITLSQTVDDGRRGKKSLDKSDISKPRTGDATKPSTKKKNMMSLVYKVNTKTLDLDKFDRKKTKPSSKSGQDETINQTNGKSVEHRREQSSASSFFNDDLSICYKDGSESAKRTKALQAYPTSIQPLKDLEKLRKSSDNSTKPLDTPHF